MTNITVIVCMRDLLTWPKAMIECIEKFSNLESILLVDNDSTYPPLIEYYEKTPHKVIKLGKNAGHKAPWLPEVKAQIATNFYVVTDPDLDLTGVPNDCLYQLAYCLAKSPWVGKVGLGLTIDDVPPESLYYRHVQSYERMWWRQPLIQGKFRNAPVDTTFAVYNKTLLDEHHICGVRMEKPYVASHIPWRLTPQEAENNEEFQYFLQRANDSSSYLTSIEKLKRGERIV